MASVVLGIGTSHTPLLILPPELWLDYAARDLENPELVFPPDGLAMPFADAVRDYVPEEIQNRPRDLELFQRQYRAAQDALDTITASIQAARPDAVVLISDDQDEWFYDDNMPAFSIYWGDSVPVIPRPRQTFGSELEIQMADIVNAGYGESEFDVPVHAALGRHLIESLIEDDFDISQMTQIRDEYSGSVRRRSPRRDGGEVEYTRESPNRRVGLPHGFSYVVQRLLRGSDAPIVPVVQNTCYPPNAVTPRRCYALGEALAAALATWDDDARIVVIASGGLSHFVVDEVIDRAVLDALEARDRDALIALPRERLRSATSECLNWVTLGGLMSSTDLEMDLLSYEPVYRTKAGTGAGLGFAQWL